MVFLMNFAPRAVTYDAAERSGQKPRLSRIDKRMKEMRWWWGVRTEGIGGGRGANKGCDSEGQQNGLRFEQVDGVKELAGTGR